jgi:dihydromethanopterin reductase (acceptor)
MTNRLDDPQDDEALRLPERRTDEAKRSRIAWGITGSGHGLKESLDVARAIHACTPVDLFLSAAGAEVLKMYGHDLAALKREFTIYPDNTASAAPVARFYHDEYGLVVIAPATSNTVAKCALGLSDTLVTNMFAQAGKCRVQAIVFACDTEPAVQTEAPKQWVMVYPRAIDLQHSDTLARMKDVQVVATPEQLYAALMAHMPRLLAANKASIST